MARLDALPSIDIIRGFKGTLDFYLWKGLPCVRAWPRYRPASQTEASRAAAATFGLILQSYRLIAQTVSEAYQEMAQGIPRTPRDIYVSGILGHLHERTPPVPPPTTFTVWSPDAPPVAPSDLDDEFDDASFDAVLWTEFDPGGLLAVSENETGLILDGATQAGDDLCGIYQPIPAVDFSITAKLALVAPEVNFSAVALALWDDATNPAEDLYTWQLTYRAADQVLDVIRWTNYTTFGAGLWSRPVAILGTHRYLRIRRIAGTYYFDWSSDGLGWHLVYSGALVFVPNHFGIIINNVNSGITIRGIATFFRYTPYGTFNLLLQGDRINADRTP